MIRSRRWAALLAAAVATTLSVPADTRADEPPAPGAPAAPKLTKPPRLVTFVPAEYPPEEKAAGRTASVVLRVGIGLDGRVTDVAIERSAGAAFDAAALAAVKQFVFEPAEVDGKPSPVRILYQYDFTIAVEEVKKTTADFGGLVRARATKKPLAGVTVSLDAADGRSATSDADGRFVILDAAPGHRTVTLAGAGITALQTTEDLEAGKRLDVIYDLTPQPPAGAAADEDSDDLEIVVVAPPLEKATASVQVVAAQARKLPGTGGDVLKVVESMPGVARPAVGSGALVVWGAAPADTRVYVEGVRIPLLYHTGGLRSVIATDMVGGIELVPGGYGAPYGRGLGGLVLVGLAPLAGEGADALHGSLSADVIDSAASVRAPLTPHLHLAVAARRSQLDQVLAAASDEDVGAFFPIPVYYDGQLRLAYDPTPRLHFEAGALVSYDQVTRTVASSDPAASRSQDKDLGFGRVWLRLQDDRADGSQVAVVAYGGADASTQTERFGATPTRLENHAGVYGARASWRGRVLGRAVLTVGLDAELVDAHVRRQGSLAVPAREGDVRVFGQPPPDQIAFDAWSVVDSSLAPYAQLDASFFDDKLHVIPGLRVEPFVTSVSRLTPVEGATPAIGRFGEDTAVQPRLALRWDATPRLGLRAAFGRYRQAPDVEDLSAVFGSPTLPDASATHYVLGASYRLTAGLSAEVTAFLTESERLAVRSPASTPLLAQALVPDGSGRVVGAQLLLRQELTHGVFGWLSYGLVRSERSDAEGARARLFDFDQTHMLTAVVSWDLGHGLELGSRFRVASGMPRTPVVGAYFDARTDAYQPLFGAHNGERLPAFVQLDVRVAKRFRLGGDELEVYLDVQNATDRENSEEVVYNADFTQKSYIRGLPFLPVAGARLSW